MRRILRLVGKDLRRKSRAPLGLLVVLSFPLLFAGMIALVFGGHGSAVPKVRLLVENHDGDRFVSKAMVSSLTSAEMAEYFDVRVIAGDGGAALIEKGEASALLRIPAGFSEALLNGRPTTLALVRNPAEGILPEIAEQGTRMLVEVLDGGERVLRGPLERLKPYLGTGRQEIGDEAVGAIAVAVRRSFEGASRFLAPPVITLEGAFGAGTAKETAGQDRGGDTLAQIFLLILPGVAVYALFLVGDQGMRDLLTEIASGTLRRQLAGPITAGTIVVGKAAFTAALSLVALVLLSAVGALVGRVGADPAGFVALSLAIVLAVTGCSATIYGLARNERQGATLSSLVYLVLAFSGGSFIPLDSLPPSVRAVSFLSPFYWGTDGYRRLLTAGADLRAILPNVAVLGAIGAVLLAVGSAALGRAVRRGAGA